MSTKKNTQPKKPHPVTEEIIITASDTGLNIYDNYIKGKEFYLLMALVLLTCGIVFIDFIFYDKIYLFKDIGSDTINSYFPILIDNSNYARTHDRIGWNFNQGMGQNIFPGFYGDLFFYFLTLFNPATIPYGLVYMEILKIGLLSLFFYKFLKEVKLNNFTSLLFSLLISFSGFVIVGGSWVYFSTEALYIAIILYGYERWLNHQEIFFLGLGIILLAFTQPFLLFVYTFILGAYAIVRYYEVKQGSLKDFLFFIFKSIGIAVVAVFISSYQLFANILQMIESPRVSGDASFFSKLGNKPMFELADVALRFTTTLRTFSSDMIGNGSDFKGWQNYLEAPVFYCGILCLVAFPQFFVFLSNRQKKFYGALALLFAIPIFFPYFRYAFWAFTGDYFRTFSFVITLLLVFFAARAMNLIEENHKVNKVVLGVTVLFMLFLLYSPSEELQPLINTSLRDIVAFLILVYAALLYGMSLPTKTQGLIKIVILLCCLLEVGYFSSISVNERVVMTKTELSSKVGYNDYSVDAVDYLKKTDKTFYRINKDYSSGLAMHSSINDSKVQGFYGTQSYYSFNQKNYIKFLGDLDIINTKEETATRWAKGLVDRPILFSLASGKYWLSKRPDNQVASMGFDSIAKFGDVKVYKNKFAVPLGVTYQQIISEDDFKKLSPTQKDFCLLRACVIQKGDLPKYNFLPTFNMADTSAALSFEAYLAYTNELRQDSFSISAFNDNHIAGSIINPEPKILFFSIPYDEGWKATVNGKVAELSLLNCGLMGLKIEKGKNEVALTFEPRYKRMGAYVSLISLSLFIGLLLIKRYYFKTKTANAST